MEHTFLKPYTLVIKTLSPVHIGTGVKLGKADFVLLGDYVYVIDENKLANWILDQPNAEKLASALAEDLRRPEGGVEKFLKESFREDLNQVSAYRLSYRGSPKDIAPFIKTTRHQPYIPGSSMKGVLRSGLLRGKMLGDLSLRQKASIAIDQGAADSRRPKTKSDEIQANAFVKSEEKPGKWPNYDINRLLVIRDSEILPSDFLEIVPVRTISVQYDENLRPKPFDIYVEALKPRKIIQNSVIWQTNLLGEEAFSLGFRNLEDVMVFLPEYCRRVSKNLLTQEREFYERHGRKDLADWFQKRMKLLTDTDEVVFILPMGWGSGYDAKTITDLLDETTFEKVVDTYKNTWGLGKPGRNKDAEWLGPDDSPKSRKVIEYNNGTVEPMGWVAMRFVSADKSDDWLAERRIALAKDKPAVYIILEPQPVPQGATLSSPDVVDETSPSPIPLTLIEVFSDLPKVNDGFEGRIFSVDPKEVLVEIPGLDPDEKAYAVLVRKDNPILGIAREGQTIRCQVLILEEDKVIKNCQRVLCRMI